MSDFKFKEGDIVLCVLPEQSFEAKIISRHYIREDGETPTYQVQAVKTGIEMPVSEDKMLYSPNYGVSYIASAPEELKVLDRVEVMNIDGVAKEYVGKQGNVLCVHMDGGVLVAIKDDKVIFPASALRKLPDTISFEEDSDNMKTFKAILDEMVETYRAKDADYGSAYDDGYRLFGHTQLLSRIYEKFSRVKHLLDGNKPNVAENIYDTLTDMAVQAICLRMLLQKNDFENVD